MFYKYKLPQFPQYEVFVSIFEGVSNLEEIKQGILSLNAEYDYCFINAANIVSIEQLNSSISKTLTNYEYPSSTNNRKLKTTSIHAEILLNLSPNKNIIDSLKRFGISSKSNNLIVLKIHKMNEDKKLENLSDYQNLLNVLKFNKELVFKDENLLYDLKTIKKNYKLSANNMVEDNLKELSNLLIGIIMLKDY